jgi:hypothetical protein
VHDLGFSVAAVHVEPIPRPADLTSDENRFYGKIHVNEAVDLDGCSGGPIFAVRRGTDGQLQFGLAGMQTAWFEESQVICATHGDYIFAYLEIIHTVERHNPAELIAVEDWARLEKLERIQQELLKNVKLDLMLPNWVRAQSSASKASILLPRPNSVKGHNSR